MCYMFCLDHQIQINFPSLFIQHLTHFIENHCVIEYGDLITSLLSYFKSKTIGWPTLGIKKYIILNEKTLYGLDLPIQNRILTQGRIASSSSQKRKLPRVVEEEQVEVILEEQVPKSDEPKEEPPKKRKIVAKKPTKPVPK